ncbi:uncharacterized protein LOC134687361 [Mytilus trossulus]|uniref:uncharacterized protein LOC134687361 n=1 Tax=Mytilus trossulus TaxID=6551 RepID=UPI00300513A6
MDCHYIQLKDKIPAELTAEVLQIPGSTFQVSKPDLDDEKKRWLIVGICLNSIVAPALRQYVAAVINRLYSSMKLSHSIHTQVFPNHLKKYLPTNRDLNYEAVNNNKNIPYIRGKKDFPSYNYDIQNGVDFSKLFLVTHMAHFTGFDHTCDSSALLGLLINIDKFPPNVKKVAEKIRSDIRNPWAHCDFTEWDSIKYLSSFQMMHQLIKNLTLSARDENSILGELQIWESNGIQFLQGNTIGLDLLEEITKHTKALAKYVLKAIDETDENFQKVEIELLTVQDDLSTFTLRFQQIESNQQIYSNTIAKAQEDISGLIDKTTCITSIQERNIKKIEDSSKTLQKALDGIKNLNTQTKEMEENVYSLTENLNSTNENISEIKEDIENLKYTSSVRPEGKVYFYPPDRIKFFVGRTREIGSIQENFLKRKGEQYTFVVCGLGGCGKTTVAIEYSWQFQTFYPGGVFWVSAESTETLETSISNLAIDINTIGKTAKETLFRTLKWIASLQTQWLLVVDNADADELLGNTKELLLGSWKRNTLGHILITSRREPQQVEESLQIDECNCLYLDVLTKEEGLMFMKTRTCKNKNDENETILELIEELGGLPLALEQAGAYIKTKKCTFIQYMGKFTKLRQKLLNAIHVKTSQNIGKARLAVRTTWQLNIEYIQKQSEEEGLGTTAVKIMEIASFLFPDDIPVQIINNGSPSVEDEEICEALQDTFGVKQVTEILTRFSLFQQYREDALSVHRLVQEVIRDTIQDLNHIRRILHFAARMINKALESALSPYKALCIDKSDASERGSLYLWSKIALNSNTLKSHIQNFTRDKKIDFSCLNIEIARLFHTTAVFHSVHQRQDEALADQEQLLNIMTAIEIPQDLCTEFTSVKIPLLEKERSVIQDSLSAVLALQSEKREILLTDETEMLRMKGNEAFKDNRYHDAIQYYSEGIRFSKEDLVDVRLFSNRSLMYLKINDYENALKDAEKCIILAPAQWKAHCWKAYAMANLVRNGDLPAEFEKVGLASACIAAELNDECLLEYKMKIYYPLVVFKIIQKSDDLGLEISSLEQRPNTTLLLKSGYYRILYPVVTTQSLQIIGIEDNVEIYLQYSLLITRQPDSSFTISFHREKQIHIHFENVSFVTGSAQIGVLSDAIATFYRCKISNGPKGCDDFPKCNGGSGCVTNTGECNREGKNQGFANFATGQVGSPGIWVGSGGKLIVQNCVLYRCGGGGVLADGNNACLEIRHCTIQNMRQMGVEARNGGMVKVEDNVIIDNQFHGIAIAPRGYAVISRNLIQGNGQEGIFCGGMLNSDSGHMLEMKSEDTSQAIITKNTIIQNGLSGMSLDGGTYEVSGNKIIDNWLWGMMIKSRSSAYIVGNDIFENKCGGIRIGTNYSASVIIDGNTIRDHTGPDIFAINSSEIGLKDNVKIEIETMLANIQFAEERLEYSRPPIITNRNIRRNNNTGVQHPRKAVQIIQSCCSCYRSSFQLKKCSNCGTATYCSKECQKKHWKKHKHMCKLLQKEYTIEIKMKDTKPVVQPGYVTIRGFDPSLKGIREGPKPNPLSIKKFIVKVQSGQEYGCVNPKKTLSLYDRSVTLDIKFSKSELYYLVNECGILAGTTLSTKKIFCWASFKDSGSILCIHTDNLPPFQSW